MNKTNELYKLIEGSAKHYGTRDIANTMARVLNSRKNTENDYVAEVLARAERFESVVRQSLANVIASDVAKDNFLNPENDYDACAIYNLTESKERTIAALQEMLLWTYSPELLEQIARADWQESGCIEDSMEIQQSFKRSDEENETSAKKNGGKWF